MPEHTDGWTVETLHELVVTMFTERDRQYAQRFDAQEKAVLKSEQEAGAWRTAANEWRAAMTDRETRFATVPALEALDARLATVERQIEQASWPRAVAGQAIAYVFAGLAAIAAIVAVVVALTR